MVALEVEFHHVGVGTTRFEDAIRTYVELGHRLHSCVDDPTLDVRVAFLQGAGGHSRSLD